MTVDKIDCIVNYADHNVYIRVDDDYLRVEYGAARMTAGTQVRSGGWTLEQAMTAAARMLNDAGVPV